MCSEQDSRFVTARTSLTIEGHYMANNSKMFLCSDRIQYQIHDVTGHAYGKDVDFGILDVIHWAPAMLSSAERLLLYSLIYCLRPQRYLEIGVLKGGASLIVTKAMDSLNHDGKLVLLDPEPQIAPQHWNLIKHRCELLKGFSPRVLSDAKRVAGGAFDFVFIDGAHTIDSVLRDANGVLPFVQDGAYILFHDSFNEKVALAIDFFVVKHRKILIDYGLLTREYTLSEKSNNSDPSVCYCGFRLIQVRRSYNCRLLLKIVKSWCMRYRFFFSKFRLWMRFRTKH